MKPHMEVCIVHNGYILYYLHDASKTPKEVVFNPRTQKWHSWVEYTSTVELTGNKVAEKLRLWRNWW